ncbi:MAG: hypothetical protein ACAH17_00200 [Candidatus Paceibacterota bacterium]
MKKIIQGLHSKLTPNWEGPFKVINRSKSGSYVLQDANNHILDFKVPHEQLRLVQPPEEFPTIIPFTSSTNAVHEAPAATSPSTLAGNRLYANPLKSTLRGN